MPGSCGELRQVVQVELTDRQLERLADLLAERLRPPAGTGPPAEVRPLLTALELAARFGVDAKSIYRHALELGGTKVGRSWRFDPDRALAAWPPRVADRSGSEIPQAPQGPMNTGRKRPRRRPSNNPDCQLLPVGRVDHGLSEDARGRR
jgi:hypothetical protein